MPGIKVEKNCEAAAEKLKLITRVIEEKKLQLRSPSEVYND